MFSNQHQNIPEVFEQIVENDKVLIPLLEKALGPDDGLHLDQWCDMKRRMELKKDLMRAAEAILKWNTDKGKVG